jgi:hypothetical protein
MECKAEKESSKGHVSAPGAMPKDNQTEWTEQEKQLAEKFGVEPKLVRLLGEIIQQHTDQAPVHAEPEQPEIDDEDFQHATAKVRQNVRRFNARYRKMVLTAVLNEASEVTNRADKLLSMEKDIRAIYDKLDDKTKCMIAVLNELGSVEGRIVNVNFGNELLYEELGCRGRAEWYIKRNPYDLDVKVLATAYELAKFINDAE